MADFALTKGGVEQGRNRTGPSGSVISSAEFPAIRQVEGKNVAGLETSGDESMSETGDDVSVFRIAQTAIAGRVHESGFAGETPAAFENEVVEETAVRVGVKLRAEHGRRRLYQLLWAGGQLVRREKAMLAQFAA